MRTFKCSCGSQLFFDNSICMNCKSEVGWCPTCRSITDVKDADEGTYTCTGCGGRVVKCSNYAEFNVCNRWVPRADPGEASNAPPAVVYCNCCRYNRTVPDLKIEGNKERWYRLEAAKRRTLYDLDMLRFPYGDAKDGIEPPLAFEFKGDIIADRTYRGMDGGQKVFTGHDNGVITINIQEADDAVREKLRVEMGEAHRSLLGHFRHEFGHYVWDALIKGQREEAFTALFGNPHDPEYDVALKEYYRLGPKPNWAMEHVSAYATMHPWEDFAETFALYLDMVAALDTAECGKLIPKANLSDVESMTETYRTLGIALNEMNRSNGLLDFLPQLLTARVKEKLRFIHEMPRERAAQPQAKAAPQAAPVAVTA